MKKNPRAGNRLFLIEFLIVLFFFLIVSTVCLQLFAASHEMTQQAKVLSQAQAAAASFAEAMEAGEDGARVLLTLYPSVEADSDTPASLTGTGTHEQIFSTDVDTGMQGQTSPADVDTGTHEQTSSTDADTGAHEQTSSADAVASVFREGGTLTLHFDRDFHITEEKKESYTLYAAVSVDQSGKTSVISVLDDTDTVIFQLPVFLHEPLLRGEVLT